MIERLRHFLASTDIDLQQRLFILAGIFGSVAMVAVTIITALANQGWQVVVALVAMTLLTILSTVFAYRTKRYNLFGSVIAIVALLIVLPVGYLLGGGANSGTPIWYIVIVVFIASIFRGRMTWIFLGFSVVVFGILTYYSYLHPEAVTPLVDPDLIYLDTYISAVIVGVLVTVLIRYQSYLYEQESQLAEQQKEEIQALSDAQSRFFSSMSHEIRTPLNTIIGLNEMTLRDQHVSEEVAENAANIQNASRMLLALINDVLDISKIESGRMELSETQYETSRMLSDIVNLLWARAREKNLRFEVNVGENIPSMLYGDEMRLKQVIINVLTNAIKYTNEGSVTLNVDGDKTDANGFLMRVDVADTGIGIRKEALPYLFDSFKRVDVDRTRNVEGTGLGLAISKQLIDLMGGSITVDSIYTKGSNFHIEVPQKIVDAAPMQYNTITSRTSTSAYENIFEAPEAHVLIVDDNDMNRMVSRKLLRGTRVQADVAASGQECLDKTAITHYDVIFMDHEMPEMDGIETMQRVRNQAGGLCKDTPIIALTANAGSDMNAFYLNQGFQAYLAKPIHGSLLEATLLQFLPPELIERTAAQAEGEVISVSAARHKKPIAITVDCPCDIPEEMLIEHGILRIPFYVITEGGRFRDVSEIDSDNLFSYLEDGGEATTSPGTVEEYEDFFGEVLSDADMVVHLSISSKVSNAYDIACRAATSFDNVRVIDSHQFASGVGLIALEGARLVEQNVEVDELVEALDAYSDRVVTNVLVPSLDSPTMKIGMPGPMRAFIRALSREPSFRLRRNGLTLSGLHGGYVADAPEQFIRMAMRRANRSTKKDLLFVDYSGCSIEEQEEIMKLVNKLSDFDQVILQKASATVAANCWMHSFAIMYVK